MSEICRMAPKHRFQKLKNKAYCFECLFPGASQDKGKHHDGMCQRDFACKHKSHDKYPIKKHVLVCHNIEMKQKIKNLSRNTKISSQINYHHSQEI